MKKPISFKKFIKNTAIEYRTIVFGGEYKMDILYMEEDKDNRLADIEIDGKYLNFKLNIYPLLEEMYKDKKYKEVAEVILHEMCHLLTEPLYELVCNMVEGKFVTSENLEDVRERQTQRITNTISNLIKL